MKNTFNLYVNYKSVGQVVSYKENGATQMLPKGACIPAEVIDKDGLSSLHKIGNYTDWLKENNITEFYLQRTFSLGDILMLVPVYRAALKQGLQPYIRTLEQYCGLLSTLGVVYEPIEAVPESDREGIMLDFTVEQDHRDKTLQRQHRVETYHQILGLEYKPEDLDWSMKRENFPYSGEALFGGKPYIVFQGRGATERRGLSVETIQRMIDYFNAEDINVVYIGEKIDIHGDDEKTVFRFMDSTLRELFSLIHDSQCLITMDSSPPWVAHFTATPTIAILGPSRPQERLILHPLSPNNAVAIRLNEEINCESCFEQSEACDHKFTCLSAIGGDRLYELVRGILANWNILDAWGIN